MVTTFICTEPGCANEGTPYNMEGELLSVVCGGCKAILSPVALSE